MANSQSRIRHSYRRPCTVWLADVDEPIYKPVSWINRTVDVLSNHLNIHWVMRRAKKGGLRRLQRGIWRRGRLLVGNGLFTASLDESVSRYFSLITARCENGGVVLVLTVMDELPL